MKCPNCESDQTVVIKYDDKGDHVTRIRGCNSCGKQFVTIETANRQEGINRGRNGTRI